MTTKVKGLGEICHKYRNFFFDIDGVFWRGQVEVQYSIARLKWLREQQNTRLFFITNASVRNRQEVKQKFKRFGFEANAEEIYPTSYMSGLYLSCKHKDIKKVVCVGSDSLAEQLRKFGLQVLHLKQPVEAIKKPDSNIQLEELAKQVDQSVQALVLGYDTSLDYNKICLISLYLQRGILFLGTNPDKYTMIGDYKMPGAGSMIQTLQSATERKAQIIGKPNPFLMEYILQTQKLNKAECLMIGDNLQTDVMFANNSGIHSLCVLTGVANEETVLSKQTPDPTYYSEFL